jgi:hypothetical protein
MPDQVLPPAPYPIWMFGKRFDFNIYQATNGAGNRINLDPVQFNHTGVNTPVRRQKNQIVLHFTAGNGPAQGTIEWWNTMAARPKFFCPRWDEAPHHFGQDAAGDCPLGHGKLRAHFGGAHFVLELAQDRANAAQPYTDVIEVLPDDAVTWHGEAVNDNSIGIEHANVGDTWGAARYDAMTGVGAARRPTDRNRYLHVAGLADATANMNIAGDYQAYQEEQYLAMILLLRHLCIKHRIPRRFLGDTTLEKMSRYWHDLPAGIRERRRSFLMRFRGILSHMNCHANKVCPGPAMNRNRLFRGIIDEWWLPVQFDGTDRPYYMGPFDPQTDLPSYFRFSGGLQQELFHDANLDALQETKSYFDLDHLALYYAQTERPVDGGTYPVGRNRIWHGGVHLQPDSANSKVYAAAGGTIVAARLGGDAPTEADAAYGSQRFILIRHCVHTAMEADPGGGQRTNYQPDPTYIFTLYMHLAPVANVAAVDNTNPPWFNYWLRHRAAAADANAVFCPLVEVSVGDWIGACGNYQGRQCIHFEVVSRQELTMAPWDTANVRFHDPDNNLICDIPALDRFVTDQAHDGIDTLDILRGAVQLRGVKAFHKSEWSLANPDALTPVMPNQVARQTIWDTRLRHFMWIPAAVAACADLSTQLCDATGMMWHYHPITFMEFINRRIVAENGQVAEPDATNTNVTLEGDYLTRYVSFAGGAGVAATDQAADNQALRPYDVSDNSFEYAFTRLDLACRQPAPHDPVPPAPLAATPPNYTHFHLALLDFIESTRRIFGQSIRVNLAHLCSAHNSAANNALCVLATDAARAAHGAGHAIDISPANPNAARCRALWDAINTAHATYESNCADHGGEPSHADLPEGLCHVQVLAPQDILDAFHANRPLTAAQVPHCVFHLELTAVTHTVVWDAIIKRSTRATQAAITTIQGSTDLVAIYATQADAEAERPNLLTPIRNTTGNFEISLRTATSAIQVSITNGDLIATYNTAVDAQTEKGAGEVTPREQ